MKNIFNKKLSKSIIAVSIVLFGMCFAFLLLVLLTLLIGNISQFMMYDFYKFGLSNLFLIFSFTFLILYVIYFYSEEKSKIKLLNRFLFIIFVEYVVYAWLYVYFVDNFLNEIGSNDFLEKIYLYLKALFKIIAVSFVYIIGKLYLKNR